MPLARLRGVVEEKGDDWVIVAVGGIGLLASVPATTAEALVAGEQASLFTHLHVREDALTLFGFATRDDLVLFEQLIGVSGVGPRVALGLLAALDYAELTSAVAGGRADVLRRVPGIGQKTAERLVLELRDKVTPPAGGIEAPLTAAKKPLADAEVVAALMGLGYSQAEASAAAERLPEDAEPELPVEERVRMALQFFARA
ncbi:MAG: Holliday junction branch migration protein RuvA [Chloroflexi bacterium]|nr:Holliday junction branch migration protein RuvA [Chloroflexota bacterium]